MCSSDLPPLYVLWQMHLCLIMLLAAPSGRGARHGNRHHSSRLLHLPVMWASEWVQSCAIVWNEVVAFVVSQRGQAAGVAGPVQAPKPVQPRSYLINADSSVRRPASSCRNNRVVHAMDAARGAAVYPLMAAKTAVGCCRHWSCRRSGTVCGTRSPSTSLVSER